MKNKILNILSVFALFAAGCAFNREAVITEPVGPPPQAGRVTSSDGSLVVYSGFEVGEATGFANEYTHPHTAYDVYAPDGRLAKHVRNYAGGLDDNPESVTLPAGQYKISAKANGYARVVLPVVIAVGKTTTVYLDSSGFDLPKQNPKGSLVKLPDGQIIGWLAD